MHEKKTRIPDILRIGRTLLGDTYMGMERGSHKVAGIKAPENFAYLCTIMLLIEHFLNGIATINILRANIELSCLYATLTLK